MDLRKHHYRWVITIAASVSALSARADIGSFPAVDALLSGAVPPLAAAYLPREEQPFHASPLQADLHLLSAEIAADRNRSNDDCCPDCEDLPANRDDEPPDATIVIRVEGMNAASLRAAHDVDTHTWATQMIRITGRECDAIPSAEALAYGCAIAFDMRRITPDMSGLDLRQPGTSIESISRSSLSSLDAMVAQSFGNQAATITWDREAAQTAIRMRIASDFIYQGRSDGDWRARVQHLRGVLNQEERQLLLARIGADFSGLYDELRMQGGPNSAGSVPLLALLQGQREGTDAGVCRDIASGMGEIAQELGFSDVYVLSYQTLGAGHASLILRDPSNPGKVIHYNYGTLSTASESTGTDVLRREREVTTLYRFSRPAGGVVAEVPSDLRLLIEEAIIGDPRQADYFALPSSRRLGTVEIRSGLFRANLFTGATSTGTQVIGIAPSVRVRAPNAVGLSAEAAGGATREVSETASGPARRVFARLAARANSPWFGRTGGPQARATGNALLFGSRYLNNPEDATESDWAFNADGSLQVAAGAQARLPLDGGRTRLTADVERRWNAGVSDVRGGGHGTLFPNLTYARVGAERDLSADYLALAEIAVGSRVFGPQILAQGGVRNQDSSRRVMTGYLSRLDPNDPQWAPGMSRQAFLDGQTALGDWTIGARLERNFEDASTAVRGRLIRRIR